jgi:5,5'-dehydrodivanillate O-demethylase
MTADERLAQRGERLGRLTQTGRGTEMGTLLRTFWHPIAVARAIAPGTAKPVCVLGEDLTLYRGAGGRPHLGAGKCAHRRSVLHTGWIERDEIRCMYHGWKFDGTGQCTLRPAENDAGLPPVRIAAYATHEYGGMIFAYLGDAPAPAFELPCKDVFEGDDRIVFARSETWDCNWLQLVENSLDAAHVSFVHQKGRIGTFIENVSDAVPTLEFEETDAGIRQIATRGVGNVRVSDWTFPNNNHISVPGLQKDDPWIDIGHWNVPLDDVTTARMNIWAVPRSTPEADRRISDYFEARADYNAADHYRELFYENIFPEDTVMSLTSAQDYLAQRGQGVLADRDNEILGRSDAGIALLRRIFAREMQALATGKPAKRWRKLEHATELPIQVVAS